LIFENVAISNKNEIKDFYRLKHTEDKFPLCYDELGSFNLDTVLKSKNIIPNLEDYLMVEKIECITLKSLLQKHEVKKIDLLQIDAEGYDSEIIKSIDFNAIKPKIIRYEHINLKKNEQEEYIALLKDNGLYNC